MARSEEFRGRFRFQESEKRKTMRINSIVVITPGDPTPSVRQSFKTMQKAFEYLAETGSGVLNKKVIVGYSNTRIEVSRVTGDGRIEWTFDKVNNPEMLSPSLGSVEEVEKARDLGVGDSGLRDIVLEEIEDQTGILDGERVRVNLSCPGKAVLVFGVRGGIEVSRDDIASVFKKVAKKAGAGMDQLTRESVDIKAFRI